MSYDQQKLEVAASEVSTLATWIIVLGVIGGIVFGIFAADRGTSRDSPAALPWIIWGAVTLMGLLFGWLASTPARLLAHAALCLARIEEHARATRLHVEPPPEQEHPGRTMFGNIT